MIRASAAETCPPCLVELTEHPAIPEKPNAMPFQMPVQYDAEYDAMLEYLHYLHAKRPRPVAGFWPRIGTAYKPGGLMVVSRIVNGWREGFETHDMTNGTLRASIIADRRADAESAGNDPLAVLPAGGHPSLELSDPHWKLVHKVFARLNAEAASKPEWWSNLAWTALAKVGFADGGNPTEALWYQQQDRCRNLFRIELQTLKPGFVLILADDKSVRDFRLNDDVDWNLLDPVENVQFLGESEEQKWFMVQRWPEPEQTKIVDRIFKLLAGDDDDDE